MKLKATICILLAKQCAVFTADEDRAGRYTSFFVKAKNMAFIEAVAMHAADVRDRARAAAKDRNKQKNDNSNDDKTI